MSEHTCHISYLRTAYQMDTAQSGAAGMDGNIHTFTAGGVRVVYTLSEARVTREKYVGVEPLPFYEGAAR